MSAALAIVGFIVGYFAGRAWEVMRSNRAARALRRRSPYLARQFDVLVEEAGAVMAAGRKGRR